MPALPTLALPAAVQQLLRRYVKDVTKLYGSSLDGLVMYGSAAGGEFLPGRSNINLLMVLQEPVFPKLQQYAPLHRTWKKEQIVVPLFLTEAELRASCELFPLEYLEMQEQHVVLVGRDPFLDLVIDTRLLSSQCEQELQGNMIRLRQRIIEGGATAEAMLMVLPYSLTAMLTGVRGVFRVLGRPRAASTDALLDQLQEVLGVDPKPFNDVLGMKRGIVSPGPAEAPRLCERYVAAMEALVREVKPRLKQVGS